MTWDELEKNCLSTYAGGHHDDGHLPAFQHGMGTVFNTLRATYPSPDVCHQAKQLADVVAYMADPDNWDAETGNLKRPGGCRQEGIILYSATIKPWVFASQFV